MLKELNEGMRRMQASAEQLVRENTSLKHDLDYERRENKALRAKLGIREAAAHTHRFITDEDGCVHPCACGEPWAPAPATGGLVISDETIAAVAALSDRRGELRAAIARGEITREDARKEFPESF
jgi:hypothetical protein